jgi:hypothetical protein
MIVSIAGEVYFRASFSADTAGPPRSWTEFHPERGWAMVPGDYYYVDIAAFRDVEVHINESGLRHSALSLGVPSNMRRITIVGDSFVFGAALNEAETIAAQIRSRAGPEYQVVPVAVPGYGTGQQILFLEELIDEGYDIGEHLIFVIFPNDILDNVGLDYGTLERREVQPIFSVSSSGQLLRSRPIAPQEAHRADAGNRKSHRDTGSLFWRFLLHRGEILAAQYSAILAVANRLGLVPSISRRPGILSAWYSDGWQERWTVTRSILEWSAVRHGKSEDYELTFAFIPSPFQAGPAFREVLVKQKSDDPALSGLLKDPDRPQRLIGNLAEQLGVRFVDTSDAIANRANRYPPYFVREGHLNEYGASIVGEAIYEVISGEPGTD